jgi:hypothetical protein
MNNPDLLVSGQVSMIDMFGFWVGVVGLIIAIYQTYSARSARRIYRNGCKIRCRDASDKAQRLADNMVQLCASISSDRLSTPLASSPSSVKAYAQLAGNIGGALDVTKDWVRFCLRLNEEHQDEFNEPAITPEQLKGLELVKVCLAELEPAHASIGNELVEEKGKERRIA